MAQWQGGNNPNYSLGAELLAWLAPDNDQPLIHIPVRAYDGTPLENENGIYGRKQLLEQVEAAHHIIDAHSDLVRIVGYDYGHTLPLGNLLGEGDEEFVKHVEIPLKPENIFMAGLEAPTEQDSEIIQRLGIKTAGTMQIPQLLHLMKELSEETD